MKLIIFFSCIFICCNAVINCKSGVEFTVDGETAADAGITNAPCKEEEICLAAEGEVHIFDENAGIHKKCEQNFTICKLSV